MYEKESEKLCGLVNDFVDGYVKDKDLWVKKEMRKRSSFNTGSESIYNYSITDITVFDGEKVLMKSSRHRDHIFYEDSNGMDFKFVDEGLKDFYNKLNASEDKEFCDYISGITGPNQIMKALVAGIEVVDYNLDVNEGCNDEFNEEMKPELVEKIATLVNDFAEHKKIFTNIWTKHEQKVVSSIDSRNENSKSRDYSNVITIYADKEEIVKREYSQQYSDGVDASEREKFIHSSNYFKSIFDQLSDGNVEHDHDLNIEMLRVLHNEERKSWKSDNDPITKLNLHIK